MYSQNTIQNDASIKNNDDIQSFETLKIYSIQTISTPNHHTQGIATTSSSILYLNTPTILLTIGKQYMYFQNNGKTAQAARCNKSRIMTKVIGYVLSIDTFEQQCVVLKGVFQLTQLKDHVQTIGTDLSSSNNAIYEHKCIENI